MFSITTGLTIWGSEALTLAGVLFLAWRHDRKTDSYLFWSLGFAFSACGFALVAARGFIPNFLSIEVGNTLALIGQSGWIAGLLRLDKRRLTWWSLAPPAIWLCGVFLPWVHDSYPNRVALYNLASAAGAMALAAAALPAGARPDRTRLSLMILFLVQACLCFAGSLTIALRQPSDREAANFGGAVALGTAFLLTLAFVLCCRVIMERSEWRWRALSVTDPLTGALNRRGLQEYFLRIAAETSGRPGKIAALLFDLDHFKRVNDRYGHQAGDLVLSEFARLARQFIPRGGIFGRMGGEEFTAFVVVGDQTEAEVIAELIRAEFCRVPLLAGTSLVPVTVSIGVAILPLAEARWDELVSSADKALYAAKEAGRNCTIVFSEEDAAGSAGRSDAASGELVPSLDDQIHALRRLGTLSRM